MGRKIAFCLCLLALFAFTLACKPKGVKELCGKYVAEYNFGAEVLILKENMEYVQEVTAGSTPKVVHTGKWEYDAIGGYVKLENGLLFANELDELNKDYAKPVNGYVLELIDKMFPWSKIKLGSDEMVQMIKVQD